MHRLSIALAALAAVLGVPGAPALAQDSAWSVGLGASTLGPTIEAAYTLQPKFDLRGIAYVPVSSSITETDDEIVFNGSADTGAFALLADYYPTGGRFRMSGGVLFAPRELVSGTFTDTADSSAFAGSFGMDQDVALMAAAGYRFQFDSGVFLSAELGAVLAGFEVRTESTNADDLADIDGINDDLDDWPVYPYIAFTVGYRF